MYKDFNATLNLPKTEFPMRAGLAAREPEMLKRWEEQDIYNELLKVNEGKPLFSLHDGPPFSNGELHMGHALNKCLKDFIVRAAAMRGYYTPYIPGWDNHGMPIESAIIKETIEKESEEGAVKLKSMNVADFRTACHNYALKYVGIQKEQFKRLGVIGDWEHPYMTMSPSFEAEEVKIFGEMYKKGYIYKGLKPVYWCPKCETALAEAEIEYEDDKCTTVYVKFPIRDDLGKLSHLELSKLSFVIWTTTIWTLPGNLGISLHPDVCYAIVKVESGEMYVMAQALVEKVMGVAGIESWEILETHPGSFFENMLADHPFLPKTSRLLNADYVTTESGTGCVHTAPGFGADDYATCRRYGMDLVVPVDDRGRHTDYAGKYAGMSTEESNPVILADMKESGALLASENIVHSYPHCWKCKGPIIFRATPQWFCSVDSFKDAACEACDDVRWLPGWGIDRIKSMVRERTDWCISRQRKWGLPIPVVYCPHCGKPICNDESINAISELFGREGSNAWFLKEADEILPEGFTCPHCGCDHGFTKEENTLDGWFDSGSSHFASMKRDQGFWPCDVYIEGLDQYRGWFQASLLTAVGALGAGAPFKVCLTHGWTVDKNGKAMHKSDGNGVAPNDIIKQSGADMVRLWAASADYHADMRCDLGFFVPRKKGSTDPNMGALPQNYMKFRNTARYILGNLDGFDANDLVSPKDMPALDKWAITKLNALIEKCEQAYCDYEFNAVTHAVNDFCVVEMSNFYLDIIKDRLYCEERNGLKRRSAQTAMYLILDTITKIMAPILAFTCDEIWQAMPHSRTDDGRNVVFNQMNKPFEAYALGDMISWSSFILLRSGVNSALEAARAAKLIGKSLEAQVTLVKDASYPNDNLASLEEQFAAHWADLFIVSKVSVSADPELYAKAAETPIAGVRVLVSEAEGTKCPRCWCHSTEANEDGLCPRCAAVVAGMDI